MRIRRSRLTGDFLQVPNATVRDDRLSHMARGILVELLSRPDGWEATADDMWRASSAKHGKASPGRRAFRAAFAELKEYGYLTSERIALPNHKHGTTLAVTDIPAAHADVPHGGTSAPPAKTGVSAAQTGVPHAGTPGSPTDVPHAGTSARPAETPKTPAHTDVPHGGTPDSPAETPKTAGRPDVPHAGTSLKEHGKKNTGKKNTSSSASGDAGQSSLTGDLLFDGNGNELAAEPKPKPEDPTGFEAFYAVYPRRVDKGHARKAYAAALKRGADPAAITAAAARFRDDPRRASNDIKFTPHPSTWLNGERYDDEPDPQPEPQHDRLPAAGATNVTDIRTRQQAADDAMFERQMARARARREAREAQEGTPS